MNKHKFRTWGGKLNLQKQKYLFAILFLFFLLFRIGTLFATPSLLDKMPTANEVMNKMKTKAAYNTAIRQYNALTKLSNISVMISNVEQNPSGNFKSKNINTEYSEAMRKLNVLMNNPPMNSYTNWGSDRLKYEYDKIFINEIIFTFFSASDALTIKKIVDGENKAINTDRIDFDKNLRGKEISQQDYWFEIIWKVALGILYVLMVIGILVSLKLFRKNKQASFLDKDDCTIFRARKKFYKLFYITGGVVDKDFSTTHYGNIYHGDTIINHQNDVNHERFLVQCHDGIERPYSLTNTGIQLRKGSLVSIAHIMPEGFNRGDAFLFYNHDQNKYTVIETVLKTIFPSRSIKTFMSLLFVALMCLCKVLLMWAIVSVAHSSLWWLWAVEGLQLVVAVFALIILPAKLSAKRTRDRMLFRTEGFARIILELKKHLEHVKANAIKPH